MKILHLFLLIAVAVIQAISIEFVQRGLRHSVCPQALNLVKEVESALDKA